MRFVGWRAFMRESLGLLKELKKYALMLYVEKKAVGYLQANHSREFSFTRNDKRMFLNI